MESPDSAQLPAVSVRRFIVHYGVYVSLAVLLIAAAFVTPDLYSERMRFVVFRQASQLGIVAIGQTLVLLVAGLDLSVGGVIVLSSVIIAEVSGGQDNRLLPALLVVCFCGALTGQRAACLSNVPRLWPRWAC
jgi:ribose/xylose/arabinose/galactoside ABC-type transport system permease subunit